MYVLFKILRHYGIPWKITDAITAIYTNSSSRVRLGNHFSKAFSITAGVLQGDKLAPILFIIVVDYILRQTDDSHGLKTHAENPEGSLPDLDFADNIVLLDIAAAEHYDNLQSSASQAGLRINIILDKALHLKLRLFDSFILSILLYGAKSWVLVEIIKNQLNSFATSCF